MKLLTIVPERNIRRADFGKQNIPKPVSYFIFELLLINKKKGFPFSKQLAFSMSSSKVQLQP